MLVKPFDEVIYVEHEVNITPFAPHIETFKSQIDILLSQPFLHKSVPEQLGNVVTTSWRPNALVSLKGYKELINCLWPYFSIARDSIYKDPGDIKIKRAWLNVMHKNSFGLSHVHGTTGLVGVFYLNAPLNSGKFVIINDNKLLASEKEFPEEKKYYIDATPFTFICHSNTVFHAVSEHHSDISRVSIIIEVTVSDLNLQGKTCQLHY